MKIRTKALNRLLLVWMFLTLGSTVAFAQIRLISVPPLESKVSMADVAELEAEAGFPSDDEYRITQSGIGKCHSDPSKVCWQFGITQFYHPSGLPANLLPGLVRAAQARMKKAGAPIIGVRSRACD